MLKAFRFIRLLSCLKHLNFSFLLHIQLPLLRALFFPGMCG
jgi:hypothetical protein